MKFRLSTLFDDVVRASCAFLMGAMALAVILSVFFRYVFSLTTVWSEELITVLFLATSFLGTAMVAADDEHISIDFIFGAVPKRAAAALRALVSLIVLSVMVVVFLYALPWIAVSGELETPGLEIPFKWLYALLPTSCVLVCIVEVRKIFRRLRTVVIGERIR